MSSLVVNEKMQTTPPHTHIQFQFSKNIIFLQEENGTFPGQVGLSIAAPGGQSEDAEAIPGL